MMSVTKSESECAASAIIAELCPTMPATNLNSSSIALIIPPTRVTLYISFSLVITVLLDLEFGCKNSGFLKRFAIFADETKTPNKMEAKEQVLQAMREAGAPVNAGKVAEMTGLDRKIVDKAFDALKKEGAIVSPVRCKWEPAK